jgi:hypothetical protein
MTLPEKSINERQADALERIAAALEFIIERVKKEDEDA